MNVWDYGWRWRFRPYDPPRTLEVVSYAPACARLPRDAACEAVPWRGSRARCPRQALWCGT